MPLEFTTHLPMVNVGYLPHFVDPTSEEDPTVQINRNYVSGWNEFEGFELLKDKNGRYLITYPGDPAMKELARAKSLNHTIVLFQHDWVVVVAKDGSFRAARLD